MMVMMLFIVDHIFSGLAKPGPFAAQN